MPDLLVRNVPEALVASLKRQAAEHRRSLQQELVNILEAAAHTPARQSAARMAAAIRARLARRERKFTESAVLIRKDRGR